MADIFWIGNSPAPNIVQTVALYNERLAHARQNHPEIVRYIGRIGETIQSPTAICLSQSRPHDSVVFFNSRVTDFQGQILTIPVDVKETPGKITSIYFRHQYRGGVLWTP